MVKRKEASSLPKGLILTGQEWSAVFTACRNLSQPSRWVQAAGHTASGFWRENWTASEFWRENWTTSEFWRENWIKSAASLSAHRADETQCWADRIKLAKLVGCSSRLRESTIFFLFKALNSWNQMLSDREKSKRILLRQPATKLRYEVKLRRMPSTAAGAVTLSRPSSRHLKTRPSKLSVFSWRSPLGRIESNSKLKQLLMSSSFGISWWRMVSTAARALWISSRKSGGRLRRIASCSSKLSRLSPPPWLVAGRSSCALAARYFSSEIKN